MAVKRRKIDASCERGILIGMIMSDRFLREIIPMYNAELMEIHYGPIVAKWCIDFFKKYEVAPKENVKDLFNRWLRTKPDDELVTYIEEFLASLSNEYEHADKFNAELLMDRTIEHFKKRSYKNLRDDIDYGLENENLEDVEAAVQDFHKIEKMSDDAIDPIDDENAIRAAFENKEEILFKVPGALGRMLNPQLTRNSFVVFMAPEKRGKTWWLMWLAEMARKSRCNVAYFSCGDMSEDQQVRRHHIYLARKSDDPRYCGELLVPILDCEKNQKGTCKLRCRKGKHCIVDEEGLFDFEDAPHHIPCNVCQKDDPKEYVGAVWHTKRGSVKPLTWQEAFKTGQEYKKKVRAKGYKLKTVPNDTLSITGMRNYLDLWERTEGFIPDVILCDYMDLLIPEEGSGSVPRDQENKKWKAGRRMSQELHCCFISVTQSDAASALVPIITTANFSEDKRKFAHVTAMYALNQFGDEKSRGIMRVGPLVVREDQFDVRNMVHVLQCISMGQPYLSSF